MCVWGGGEEGGGEVPMLLVLVDTMPSQDISSPLAVRSVHGRELLTSVMRGFMDAKPRHFKNHFH